jgi:hypothetical protein
MTFGEYISQIFNPVTNHVFLFPPATEYQSDLDRPSSTFSVPGSLGYLDGRGFNPNPLAPRVVAQKFLHRYTAGESYSTVMRDLYRDLGGGETIQIYKKISTGSTVYNLGKCVHITEHPTIDDGIVCSLDVTFSLDSGTWSDQFLVNHNAWDDGRTWDSGTVWDQSLDTFLLQSANVGYTLSCLHSDGSYPSAYEYPDVTISGPYHGPIYVYFLSIIAYTLQGQSGYQGFIWNENIKRGESLTVSTRRRTVMKGAFNAWDTRFMPFTVEWGFLKPGSNSILIQSGANQSLVGSVSAPVATVAGGAVTGITAGYNGIGYLEPPLVTIAPPSSGTTATAHAIINAAGSVTSYVIDTPGTGYGTAPVVTVTKADDGRASFDWKPQDW